MLDGIYFFDDGSKLSIPVQMRDLNEIKMMGYGAYREGLDEICRIQEFSTGGLPLKFNFLEDSLVLKSIEIGGKDKLATKIKGLDEIGSGDVRTVIYQARGLVPQEGAILVKAFEKYINLVNILSSGIPEER